MYGCIQFFIRGVGMWSCKGKIKICFLLVIFDVWDVGVCFCYNLCKLTWFLWIRACDSNRSFKLGARVLHLELLIRIWGLSFSFDTHGLCNLNLKIVLVDTHLIHSLHIHLEFLIWLTLTYIHSLQIHLKFLIWHTLT